MPDSGGPGALRGGLGQVIEIAHAHGGRRSRFRRCSSASVTRPADDGAEDLAARAASISSTATNCRAKGKETVPAGAILVLETPGGGGVGDPISRDPAAVRRRP